MRLLMKYSCKSISIFFRFHCRLLLLTVFLIYINPGNVFAQQDTMRKPVDSFKLTRDTISTDTSKTALSKKKSLEDSLGIKISKDALPAEVTALATDSAVMEMDKNVFYLYGNAQVNYDNLELKAGEVTYKQSSSMITARPIFDSSGMPKEKPTFKQGSETFTYDSMQYNFKSKRAIVRNAHTKYGEGYVISDQVKRNPDQSIYGRSNIYTTCSLDTPHFGIRARRIKVIPNRIIASGSADLEIEGVPTPFYLPFGLFPITETQRSGFRIPAYTLEEQRGLGLTNGGYYFYINDYVDMLVLSSLYSKGSWNVDGRATYKNIYHYDGSFRLAYAYTKTGETFETGASITKDFQLDWVHRTDAKASPGTNFNSNVHFGTSSFYSNTSYNVNQLLQNQYSSNISYSKTWPGKPYSLTIAARHSQNTISHQVDLTLPDVSFSLGSFTPFKRRNGVGTPKWFEKVTMAYSVNALNQASFYDSTISLDKLGAQKFKNGIRHSASISASYNVLRFVNLTFSAPYTEYWLTEKNYYQYDSAKGKTDTVHQTGFYTGRDFNTSMSMNTRIYGQRMFKKGKVAGVRHVLTPSLGMTYTPDFAATPFNYYYKSRQDTSQTRYYRSPYEGSVIGQPGLGQFGKFRSDIDFGINNNLQIKVRNRVSKDSVTTKNVTLIDGFSINSHYNIAADSFRWSNVNMSFRTSILDKINISGNAVFDPYTFDYNIGRRLQQTVWDKGSFSLGRFQSASIALGSGFRSGKRKSNANNTAVKTDEYSRLMQNGRYNDYIDFNVPWGINFSYSLTLNNVYSPYRKADSTVFSQHGLTFSGDFNLTPRWKFAFNSGYDIVTKKVTLTSFDIYRDLHCWEMRLGLIPFGVYKSFNFSLNVKAAVLQDLKLLRRRDYRDAI